LLLLFLLAVAQAPAAVGPQYDLASYLRIAGAYGSGNRAAAVREIRAWPPVVIEAALADLRGRGRQLRPVPASAGEIAFGTVEAAVLMHAEAGLLALQAASPEEAADHLGASVTLFQWSRDAAAEAQRSAEARNGASGLTPGLEIRPRIGIRDFSVALAAGALAAGSPTTARPFAERARQVAPLDPEVQLLYGCVAEGLAEEQLLRNRESDAAFWRDQGTLALMDALALDEGLLEAHLHVGRLNLERGRFALAARALKRVDANSSDDRQRYLARLFLGRLAERRGRLGEAVESHHRALEAWPDSQAARLALGHVLERSSGPTAALPLVAESLAAPRRLDREPDPWRLYLFGPPGLARTAFDRVYSETLDR
jgi:tetratricopeptide (TPR) repeat protein